MENIILTQYKIEELKGIIKESIREAIIEELSLLTQKSYPDIMNLEQASEFLKIPKNTIYVYTSQRIIPYTKKGKRLRFLKTELIKWLSEGRKETISEIRDQI